MASILLSLVTPLQHTYQQSFYPRTIREWNNLPITTIETIDIEDFTGEKLSDFNLM